ncbi:MAG: hypothetical protein ABJN69_10845 [Hellea sp.]
MQVNVDKYFAVLRKIRALAAILIALLLVLTFVYFKVSQNWVKSANLKGEEAFLKGAIGTEVMPLVVLDVLPDMFPENFQPAGVEAGDWIDQFGFIRDPKNEALPVGFTLSNRRPKSGAPSPVPFVALTCALCHSTEIQPVGTNETHFIIGPGNRSLNLFSWLDAFQASILDEEKLTLETLEGAYHEKHGRKYTLSEKLMTRLWLNGIRKSIGAGLPRFDEPFGHGKSRDPSIVAAGPTRTFPFRTIVRSALNRPGEKMAVYTKISTIYLQKNRRWAQVDGSINDIDLRSATAAFAAGATVQNLKIPEIANTVKEASKFTETLQGPPYAKLFPAQAALSDPDLVERGRQLYMTSCNSCHGHRTSDGLGWVNGARHGEIIPLEEIGTDPERVVFRHYERITAKLVELFQEPHPFPMAPENLRAPNEVEKRGYVAAPIETAYLRAPYLHNASVMTLAELINLQPRRTKFYRGRNAYDPENVGFISPAEPNEFVYFEFDTSLRGNSNKGHDYPWSYDDPDRDPAELKALLAYLKTL